MIEISVLEKLEYGKILGYIAKYCFTEIGKENVLATTPLNDIKAADHEGSLVTEAKEIYIKNIPPPLEYLPDLRVVLTQSTIENSVLDSKKILEVFPETCQITLNQIQKHLLKFMPSAVTCLWIRFLNIIFKR